MTRVLATLFLIPLLLLAGPIRAEEAPKPAQTFDGTFALDRTASNDLRPIMKARGVPAMYRGVMHKMDVTQVIEDQGDKLVLQIQTSVKTRSMVLTLDGAAREEAGDMGTGSSMVSSVRKPDGSIVTTSISSKDGVEMTMVVVRVLEDDGATMVQNITLEQAGEAPLQAKRIFRKQ